MFNPIRRLVVSWYPNLPGKTNACQRVIYGLRIECRDNANQAGEARAMQLTASFLGLVHKTGTIRCTTRRWAKPNPLVFQGSPNWYSSPVGDAN